MKTRWTASGSEPQVWAYGARRRLDASASGRFPLASRGRLALQIRQDLWRTLRTVRGFSPVVSVSRDATGLDVVAGGQLDGAAPRARLEAQIADLLSDPARRQRWIAHAQRRGVPARARGACRDA